MWSGRWLFVNRIDHLHRITVEHCTLLSHYTARNGNVLPTFRENLPGHVLKGRTEGCPETPVINYHFSPCNNPQDRSSHLLRGGILKSHIAVVTCSSNFTGSSKKMDGIWNRYNLKSTGRIYTFGVLKCSEKFKVLDLP